MKTLNQIVGTKASSSYYIHPHLTLSTQKSKPLLLAFPSILDSTSNPLTSILHTVPQRRKCICNWSRGRAGYALDCLDGSFVSLVLCVVVTDRHLDVQITMLNERFNPGAQALGQQLPFAVVDV